MFFTSHRRFSYASLAVTTISLTTALSAFFPRASRAQQLTGNVITESLFNIDLTAMGTTDWAVWGYSNGGASTSLAPDVSKAGGTGISSLTNLSNGNPLRGLGQFGFYGESGFNWTDGTPTAAATNATTGLQHNGTDAGNSTIGEGFSFTAPASTSAGTVYLYFTVNQAAVQLTASLSDGSATTYSSSMNTGLGSNVGYLLTLNYSAASAAQTLTVTGVVTTDNSGENTGNFAIDAVAYSALNSSSDTPEPCSIALVALTGLPIAVMDVRRRRRALR